MTSQLQAAYGMQIVMANTWKIAVQQNYSSNLHKFIHFRSGGVTIQIEKAIKIAKPKLYDCTWLDGVQ